MAGITNAPFRTLCREQGAGLFVSEMVTARALIERRPETLRMIVPGKGEWPRSVQLYSVDPTTMRAAVTMLGKENLADHIDMNFGYSLSIDIVLAFFTLSHLILRETLKSTYSPLIGICTLG